MDLECIPCDYTTKLKANLLAHFKSSKHIKNKEVDDELKFNNLILQNQELEKQLHVATTELRAVITELHATKTQLDLITVLKDKEIVHLSSHVQILIDYKNDIKNISKY